MNEEIDWSSVAPEMAAKILEQGQLYLKAQLDVALASDRRALTLGSVCTTLATALTGGSVALFEKYGNAPVLAGGLTTAACMLVAAYTAFRSARPIPVSPPGVQPAQWWPVRHAPLTEVIGGETENLQGYIVHNEKMLKKNASILELAWRSAVIAPIAGFVVWLGLWGLSLSRGLW